MAKITINGTEIKVKNGSTILNAAKSIGIELPTLCFIEEINEKVDLMSQSSSFEDFKIIVRDWRLKTLLK